MPPKQHHHHSKGASIDALSEIQHIIPTCANSIVTALLQERKKIANQLKTNNFEEKMLQIHDLLPDVAPETILQYLKFAHGNKEMAIDLLLNGVTVTDEMVQQEGAQAGVNAFLDAFTNPLHHELVDMEQQYLMHHKSIQFLKQTQNMWRERLGIFNEEDAVQEEDDTVGKTEGTDWTGKVLLAEQQKLKRRLAEEKASKTAYFYCKGEVQALVGKDIKRYNLQPSNIFDYEGEYIHMRICESQFHRFMSSVNYNVAQAGYSVEQIEYIVNPPLFHKFNAARDKLAKKHGFMLESMKPIILFHGTSDTNMENIIQTNFLLSKIGSSTDMGWYGRGFYFSEYPGLSIGYSRGNQYLLVCLCYVGKCFKMANIQTGCALTDGYDSHTSPDGSEVVMFDPDCILPCYKVKWRTSSGYNYNV